MFKCLRARFAVVIGLIGAGAAWADPNVLPPNPPDPPPTVFCFAVTGAGHSGAGVTIQFEVLNWNKVPATDLSVSIATAPGVTTGGLFGPTPAVNAGPVGNKFSKANDWTVASSGSTSVHWVGGTPLPFIDLHPGGVPGSGSGHWLSQAELPAPLDSGINALDGFRLNLPGFNVGERVVFDWSFSTSPNDRAMLAEETNSGFDHGTFQLDRGNDGPAGEIRFATFFGIGTTSAGIGANPAALDLAATNQHALAVPAIPEPGTGVLLFSGLVAFLLNVGRQTLKSRRATPV
jgi:hypothetical protein